MQPQSPPSAAFPTPMPSTRPPSYHSNMQPPLGAQYLGSAYPSGSNQLYGNSPGDMSIRRQSQIPGNQNMDYGDAGMQKSYRNQNHNYPPVGTSAPNPYSDPKPLGTDGYGQNGYTDPYDESETLRNGNNDHDHDQDDDGRTSLGPWDSASQASEHNHPPTVSSKSSYSASHQSHHHPVGYPSDTGYPPVARLSYIQEEDYHSNNNNTNNPYSRPNSMMPGDHDRDVEMKGLVPNAAGMGMGMSPGNGEEGYRGKFGEYQEMPPLGYGLPDKTGTQSGASKIYETLLFPTGLDRMLAMFGIKNGEYPLEQAIERKRRGLGGQRFPVMSWVLTLVMTGVMIYELVYNNQQTGRPIATSPQFNYMIGPAPAVLINIGARFQPCMKLVEALPPTFQLACLNDTSATPTTSCSLETICGHGGFPNNIPNQSWRFVAPIFLHVGIIHLIVNILGQITLGAQIEREMGSVPYLIVYFAGGIYGFVLGGNFSRVGIPSVGASGALFAVNACVLVDLLLHWKYEERPKLKAFFVALEFLIGIAIGYIPNAVDGLAHLGGFAMGLLLGVILYPSISETKRHRYIVWGIRVVAMVLAIVAFILTIKNFYTTDPNAACEWCRYLSCIPVSSNQYCTGTGITMTNTSTTRRSWDSL